MNEAQVLLLTAASIAFLHTILGPDHYLVFTAMGKARSWNLAKTLRITFYCGLGHILSSVVLGVIGIAAGMQLASLVQIEGMRSGRSITPWAMFIIFVLGPCEALIPLFMYPAAQQSAALVVAVALVFGVVTLATMLACVAATTIGLDRLRLPTSGRYAHAAAGALVACCGVAVSFIGI